MVFLGLDSNIVLTGFYSRLDFDTAQTPLPSRSLAKIRRRPRSQ
jgi:hypothetical protein